MEKPPYALIVKLAASIIPISHYLLAFSSFLSLLFLFRHSKAALDVLLAKAMITDDANDSLAAGLLMLRAAFLVPASYYYLASLLAFIFWLYRFMEFHLLGDLLTGGSSVMLSFNPTSDLYNSVVSRCRILHRRYTATPWLASPHLQTLFMSLFGRPPLVSYKRELFPLSDGGTVALDWLRGSDVLETISSNEENVLQDVKAPIVVVIPGLGSDSFSPFIKHVALNLAKHGWSVCISNYRGFGGVPFTSDRVSNGGWTEDTREVIDRLHQQHPEAPLYAIGTSVGANLLVKYLGEEGSNVHLAGAAAVCCPWDLVVLDKFLSGKFMQKIYDKAITIALQIHVNEHKSVFSRIADWECIRKSRSLRDFYHSGANLMGNFKTVDTYYRHSSSTNFVKNVEVPLLCINALDDPICSREAIPWKDCCENKNIVVATTQHGGHIAHYEGASAKSMWWVRAVEEFLLVLHASQVIRKKKTHTSPLPISMEPSLYRSSLLCTSKDGTVKATAMKQTEQIACRPYEFTSCKEEDEYMTDCAVSSNLTTKQRRHFIHSPKQEADHDPTKIMQISSRSIGLPAVIPYHFSSLGAGWLSFSASCALRVQKSMTSVDQKTNNRAE